MAATPSRSSTTTPRPGHRRFWDAMHAIDGDALVEIERRLVDKMVTEFGLDLSGLVSDMTNFATYIDSANDRADIAQRGHAKQKRTDLRLVGLGLVVSVDGGVPIGSHAYAGNKPDVTQFAGRSSPNWWPVGARWPQRATSSRWCMTPVRTPKPTRPTSRPPRCISSGRCPPRTTRSYWPLRARRDPPVYVERYPGVIRPIPGAGP